MRCKFCSSLFVNLMALATGATLNASYGNFNPNPPSSVDCTGTTPDVVPPGNDPQTQEITGMDAWDSLETGPDEAGKAQSPVNIPAQAKLLAGGITPHYTNSSIKVQNNGYTIQVDYQQGSYLELNGQHFELVQFHFHTPSEHTIAGKGTAMELHLVHKNADGLLAVLGVMMQLGAENPVLAKFWDNLPAQEGEITLPGELNIGDTVPPISTGFYTYSGSLTTPPYTEGVLWHLMKQPVSVSKAQIEKYISIVGNNARSLQPLNNRPISKFL